MRTLARLVVTLVLALATSAFAQDGKPVTHEDLARFRAERPRGGGAKAAPGARPGAPKLVLPLVMDQMRDATLKRLAPHFSTGGFQRLMRQGAVLTGHYGQQNTYTGPGHALVASGAYGYLNGIMQNKWYNRRTGRSEAMLFDPQARHLSGPTDADAETSPRNFVGSTVGDELILASGRRGARVVAVAVKERGAILTGGRFGHAYYLDETTGGFTTSTYYMKELPAWAQAFNARKPLDAWFGKQWERALQVDPQFIFITSWNEWIAMRLPEFNGRREPVMFVDQYTQEYSRDIEPMKGGHGDDYYYQLVSYVRRYKGVRQPPVAASSR